MLRINNIKVSLSETDYAKVISTQLNVPKRLIKNVKLLKRSIDARRSNVHFNCSFIFEVDQEERLLNRHKKILSLYEPYHYDYPVKNNKKVTIVGSGPAGLFCAYVLSQIGEDVHLIERGKKVEERVKDVDALFKDGTINPESNISYGEGGAGTFSDGKLTTGTKNKRIRYILETFVKHGAPEEILYESLPHIGTDRLREVLISMRKDILEKGGKISFETKFTNYYEEDGKHYVEVESKGKKEVLETDDLVLAIGHSARDTYEMLSKKLIMIPKAFAVGVRIEQKQEKINEIQYKSAAHHPALKAAPYKLAVQTSKKRGVYTFCMCPGGVVVPSSEEEGLLCVNGMSYYARDKENANSAVLVNVTPDDFGHDVLDGVRFQKELEKKAYALGGGQLKAPVQKVEDYMNNVASVELGNIIPSYKPGYTLANINEVFPSFINENLKEGFTLMNKRMPGFIDEDTVITAVESRSSAPVRITRDKQMHSNVEWIYPIGEGAGYAGGIMSSAVDGILCAEQICKH